MGERAGYPVRGDREVEGGAGGHQERRLRPGQERLLPLAGRRLCVYQALHPLQLLIERSLHPPPGQSHEGLRACVCVRVCGGACAWWYLDEGQIRWRSLEAGDGLGRVEVQDDVQEGTAEEARKECGHHTRTTAVCPTTRCHRLQGNRGGSACGRRRRLHRSGGGRVRLRGNQLNHIIAGQSDAVCMCVSHASEWGW